MKLSFGMIFSILLIIVFLGFAFFAIKTFLGLQSSGGVGNFLSDLQDDVDTVWKVSQAAQTEEYFLPQEIEYVCLIDASSPEDSTRALIALSLSRSSSSYVTQPTYGLSLCANSLSIRRCNIARSKIRHTPVCSPPYCAHIRGCP